MTFKLEFKIFLKTTDLSTFWVGDPYY